jgi:translation initiation factor 5B
MAMLRERLAAQKALEEEEERLKQEAIKAIEDEEANLVAEEKRIAEAKKAKKDKAKEKMDELKKAGLYLTPAQKVFLDCLIFAGCSENSTR